MRGRPAGYTVGLLIFTFTLIGAVYLNTKIVALIAHLSGSKRPLPDWVGGAIFAVSGAEALFVTALISSGNALESAGAVGLLGWMWLWFLSLLGVAHFIRVHLRPSPAVMAAVYAAAFLTYIFAPGYTLAYLITNGVG